MINPTINLSSSQSSILRIIANVGNVIILRSCFVCLSFLAVGAAVGRFAVDDLVAAVVADVCGEVAAVVAAGI